MSKYNEYKTARPVGVLPLSNFGGLVVLAISYGINDTAVSAGMASATTWTRL